MESIEYALNAKDSEKYNPKVYIKKIYYKCDENESNDLETDNTIDYTYDSSTCWTFKSCNHCFIDKRSAFDSIIDFGKKLATKPEELNEKEIINSPQKNSSLNDILDYLHYVNSEEKKNYRTFFTEVVEDFIDENFYPYATFDKEDLIINFCKDCMTFYILYQIHIWTIKIIKNINESAKNPSENKELKKLIENLAKNLDFVDFKGIVYTIDLNKLIFNLPNNYSTSEDYNFYINFNYQNADQNQILKYCEIIRRVLIGYLIDIIQQDNNNYLITKQKVFYNFENKEYINIETTNSLMAIVCNELLFCISSNTMAFARIPCANPNCTNYINNKGRTKYCDNQECQKYRKNKKSNDSYHRQNIT